MIYLQDYYYYYLLICREYKVPHLFTDPLLVLKGGMDCVLVGGSSVDLASCGTIECLLLVTDDLRLPINDSFLAASINDSLRSIGSAISVPESWLNRGAPRLIIDIRVCWTFCVAFLFTSRNSVLMLRSSLNKNKAFLSNSLYKYKTFLVTP